MISQQLKAYANKTVNISSRNPLIKTNLKSASIFDMSNIQERFWNDILDWIYKPEDVYRIDFYSFASELEIEDVKDIKDKLRDANIRMEYLDRQLKVFGLSIKTIVNLEDNDKSIINRVKNVASILGIGNELENDDILKEAKEKLKSVLDNAQKLEDKLNDMNKKLTKRYKTYERKLQKIKDACTEEYKQTAIFTMYLGLGFIHATLGMTEINAPLILYPISINIVKGEYVEIGHLLDRDVVYNNTIVLSLNNIIGNKNIDISNLEVFRFENVEQTVNFINELCNKIKIGLNLNSLKVEHINLTENGIYGGICIGKYKLTSSIYNDIVKMSENSENDDNNSSVDRLFSFYRDDINKDEIIYTISKLDASQTEAIKAVNSCSGTVIFGPPGTGKSEVIVNIIADQVFKGKKVLLVSQKTTALDVVYNRLSSMRNMAIYIKDGSNIKGLKECISRRFNPSICVIDNSYEAILGIDHNIGVRIAKLDIMHTLLSSKVDRANLSISSLYRNNMQSEDADKIMLYIIDNYDWVIKRGSAYIEKLYSSVGDDITYKAYVKYRNLQMREEEYQSISHSELLRIENYLNRRALLSLELEYITNREKNISSDDLLLAIKNIDSIEKCIQITGIQLNRQIEGKDALDKQVLNNIESIKRQINILIRRFTEERSILNTTGSTERVMEIDKTVLDAIEALNSLGIQDDELSESIEEIYSTDIIDTIMSAIQDLDESVESIKNILKIEANTYEEMITSFNKDVYNKYDRIISTLNDVIGYYNVSLENVIISDAEYSDIIKEPTEYMPIRLSIFKRIIGVENKLNVERASKLKAALDRLTNEKEAFINDFKSYLETLEKSENDCKFRIRKVMTDLGMAYVESYSIHENINRVLKSLLSNYKNIHNKVSLNIKSAIEVRDKQTEKLDSIVKQITGLLNDANISFEKLRELALTEYQKLIKKVDIQKELQSISDWLYSKGVGLDTEYEIDRLNSYKHNISIIKAVKLLSSEEYAALDIMYRFNVTPNQVISAVRQLELHELEQSMQMVDFKQRQTLINEVNRLETIRSSIVDESIYKKPTNDMEVIGDVTVGKKNKYKSIREVINRNFEIFMNNFPIWIMTPEAVSDILPLDKGMFDVVIFDEASQIFIENSLPSIYRGNKIVVAGDDKQLKPTSFFSSRIDDAEDSIEEIQVNDESLLDRAKASFNNSHLKFHYRSKMYELIQFSNYAFYESSLNVAPNISIESAPIQYRYIENGIWENKTNIIEAEEVVNILLREVIKNQGEKSIGIITMNISQRDTIKDILEDRIDEFDNTKSKELGITKATLMDYINKLNNNDETYIFIKSIEDVQGDERDIIIFSLGYGYDKDGKLHTHLGPIQVTGGENRLNVAISRAKEKEYIVASILPSHLSVSNSKNCGPKLFKQFLNYAKAISDGNTELASNIVESKQEYTSEYESELQQDIQKELIDRGYTVHINVGIQGFYVPLAILDTNTKKYIGCIDYDSNTYCKLTDTYARDIIRTRFLESRGWKIVYTCSHDWWSNKEYEIGRIIDEIGKENKNESTLDIQNQTLTDGEVLELIDKLTDDIIDHNYCIKEENNLKIAKRKIEVNTNISEELSNDSILSNCAKFVQGITKLNMNTIDNFENSIDISSIDSTSRSSIKMRYAVIGDKYALELKNNWSIIYIAILIRVYIAMYRDVFEFGEAVVDIDDRESKNKYISTIVSNIASSINSGGRVDVVSTSKSLFRQPEQIMNTDYYFEKSMGIVSMLRRASKILDRNEHVLSIITED